ncbi:MAG: large conductance mechanosensitive channel protein MscL [Candidatus Paceibacterota bacterium]
MKFFKSFFKEFKQFALKGGVVDLAVGIIIGAAFNSIVTSLVKDIITPPLGLLIGRVDFANLYVNLSDIEYDSFQAAQAAGAPTINYGLFLNALFSFVLMALAVFLLVKLINRLRAKEAKEPETTTSVRACPFCFKEVSRKARKCPFCTADIKPLGDNKETAQASRA